MLLWGSIIQFYDRTCSFANAWDFPDVKIGKEYSSPCKKKLKSPNTMTSDKGELYIIGSTGMSSFLKEWSYCKPHTHNRWIRSKIWDGLESDIKFLRLKIEKTYNRKIMAKVRYWQFFQGIHPTLDFDSNFLFFRHFGDWPVVVNSLSAHNDWGIFCSFLL